MNEASSDIRSIEMLVCAVSTADMNGCRTLRRRETSRWVIPASSRARRKFAAKTARSGAPIGRPPAGGPLDSATFVASALPTF